MGILDDVVSIRERAERHLAQGAVTDEYHADRREVIRVLNTLLATELMCVMRYKHHFFAASGLQAQVVKKEFLEHAQEAQQHSDQLAARIIELNGQPDFDPALLAQRSLSQFGSATSLPEMIREDLIAERIAVEAYSEAVRWLGERDVTSRKVLADILMVEEQHAMDMQKLLGRLDQYRNASSSV